MGSIELVKKIQPVIFRRLHLPFTWDFTKGLGRFNGSNLSIVGGKLVITPTLGAEMWDAAAAAFTSGTYAWAAQGNNTIANVANALQITYVDNSSGAKELLADAADLNANLTIGQWYLFQAIGNRNGGGGLYLHIAGMNDAFRQLGIAATTIKGAFIANNATTNFANLYMMEPGQVITLDNLSMKPITLNTVLAGGLPASKSNVDVKSVWIASPSASYGVAVCLDSYTNPQNGLFGFCNGDDGGSLILLKLVNGVYTSLINTWKGGVGTNIEVRKSGSLVELYYNDAKVGATQNVTDPSLIYNRFHAPFSTDSGNQCTSFSITDNPWVNISVPTGWTWTLPFTIQCKERVFRPSTSFNLQTYAGITVVKTYYVDKATGNDANTGLSWAQAFKTLYEVNRNHSDDVDRIYIKPGWYFYDEAWSWPCARSHEVIGVGAGVYLTADVRDEMGAFVPDGNHYEVTVPVAYTLTNVADAATLNTFGDPTRLVNVADEAAVEATAGTWCQIGTTLFIRNFGNRVPDESNRYYCYDYDFWWAETDKTLYLENINLPGFLWGYVDGATAANIYMKDVVCANYYLNGFNEIILQNCKAKSSTGDGFNYSPVGAGPASNVIEIDCEGYNISESPIDQASTSHNATQIVRINGKYHDVSGQCIADVDLTTKVWCLGSEFYISRVTAVGVYCSGTTWLDRCYIHDVATDIENIIGVTTYKRQLISGGNNIIGGTLTEY